MLPLRFQTEWELTALVGSPNGRVGKIATLQLTLSGQVAGWTAAYGRRLRRILQSEQQTSGRRSGATAAAGMQICLDCFMLKEAFHKENERVTAKWDRQRAVLAARHLKERQVKGSEGVALDYVIVLAGPPPGRNGAARALSEAGILAC